MRLHRLFPAGLVGLVFVAGLACADSTPPPSPLRLIPAEADFLIQIHHPRRLLDLTRKLDVVEKLQKFAVVKEQLDATAPRRLRQLLAFFEKQLGAHYPELLDDIAGGGIALAGKFAESNGPVLLVLQGTNEKRVEKFLALAIEVLEGELKRQESKDRIEKATYEGVPGYKIGDLRVARLGAAIVASNNANAITQCLQLHTGTKKKSLANHPGVLEAGLLLPASRLASAWINMKPIHASPAGQALYASPRDNFLLTLLFGGTLDILGRTPFVCAGLTLDKDDLTLTVRAPRGRDGSGVDHLLHVNPADQPGSRPLLMPNGVVYSSSFYLNLGKLWSERVKLLPKAQVKGFEEGNKNSLLAFGGIRLGQVFEATAPYHRVVVVSPAKSPYSIQPGGRVPGFAVVSELKNADRFSRAVETALRLAGLTATGTFKLHLFEEKYAGHKIAGYRFDEKAVVKADVENVRFNFTPCFARVGNQFIFCSRLDLCRELIDLLVAEQKSLGTSRPETVRNRFYASGLARLMIDTEDQLITQAILDQALTPGEAKGQVRQAIALVESLGSLTLSNQFEAKQFRYDLTLRLKNDSAEARR